MPWRGPLVPGEQPTLGFQVISWIEEWCVIPDGDYAGDPFILTEEQRDFVLDFYALHEDADVRIASDVRQRPNRAFTHGRGGLLVAPQKHGKGPLSAAIICAEAYGPVLFDGWDANGNPVGRPWATPLIAVTAQSEDQSKNVWDALLPMIKLGPLDAEFSEEKDAVGLTRINIPGNGRIDPVTSSAKSRQGARITFAVQDEVQSWLESNKGIKLANTQYRSLAGMGGRFLQTCNAWDPNEHSVAQDTFEHGVGVAKLMIESVPGNIRKKPERMRVLKHVYRSAPWADLERISAEIDDFIQRGATAEAERFFFNRIVPGEDRAVDAEMWRACAVAPRDVAAGKVCTAHTRDNTFHERGCGRAMVTIGVDGARYVDALAIIATEVESGYQWPLGIWERPENAPKDYEHPFDEVDQVFSDAFETFNVWRAYVDPGSATGNISVLTDRWMGRYGEKRIVEWFMTRFRATATMVRDYVAGIESHDVKHPNDARFNAHIANTRRKLLTLRDEQGVQLWVATKEAPASPNKMDGFAAAALSWQARGDAIADGVLEVREASIDICECEAGARAIGLAQHVYNARVCRP